MGSKSSSSGHFPGYVDVCVGVNSNKSLIIIKRFSRFKAVDAYVSDISLGVHNEFQKRVYCSLGA